MTFPEWLDQTQTDRPEIKEFITKLSSLYTGTGFNGIEFERKILLGIAKIDKDVDESLKPDDPPENAKT